MKAWGEGVEPFSTDIFSREGGGVTKVRVKERRDEKSEKEN